LHLFALRTTQGLSCKPEEEPKTYSPHLTQRQKVLYLTCCVAKEPGKSLILIGAALQPGICGD